MSAVFIFTQLIDIRLLLTNPEPYRFKHSLVSVRMKAEGRGWGGRRRTARGGGGGGGGEQPNDFLTFDNGFHA